MPMLVIFIGSLLLCGLSTNGSADVIHVPGDQPNIQAGIDTAVSGDTVLVADGIWTGANNRTLDFRGKAITVSSANGPGFCTIDCLEQGCAVHFQNGEDLDSVFTGFTIFDGHGEGGGGIRVESGCTPLIANCVIQGCLAYYGGGLYLGDDAVIRNCLIHDNHAYEGGGGIHTRIDANPLVTSCTITDNFSGEVGGGVFVVDSMVMTNCIVWENEALFDGDEGYLAGYGASPTLSISYNDLGLYWYLGYYTYIDNGPGNITADPLFASGPDGDWFLGQTAAGQPAQSPCVDSGDPEVTPFGTTRTDLEPDTGALDIGYHPVMPAGMYICHEPYSLIYFAELGDPPPDDRQLEIWRCVEGTLEWTVSSPADWITLAPLSGSSTGEVDTVTVSVDFSTLAAGTELAEIVINAPGALNDPVTIPVRVHIHGPNSHYGLVAGPGPSPDNPPLVRVFASGDPPALLHEFPAYGADGYGVRVTCGDMDGDGAEEIVTGAGPGAIYGPHVRGFEIIGAPLPGLSFIAYGTHKYGVNVSCGDLDGDRYDEIVTGAGPGAVFGPHVRGFQYDHEAGTVAPLGGVSFFAYGTNRYGVNVDCGDLDGDGMAEIVTGAGPGAVFGPHVRGWNVDGGTAAPIPGISFMAYNSNHYGVNVACGDIDGDGLAEIITAPGPGPSLGAFIRGWSFDGSQVSPVPGCDIFAWPPGDRLCGARVAMQRAAGGSAIDFNYILVGGGPDPAADTEVQVYVYRTDSEELFLLRSFETFDEGMTWGVDVTGGGMEF